LPGQKVGQLGRYTAEKEEGMTKYKIDSVNPFKKQMEEMNKLQAEIAEAAYLKSNPVIQVDP